MAHELQKDEQNKYYYFDLGNQEKAICEYIYVPQQNKIFLTHTEVPRDQENKGIASELVHDVLEQIKKEDDLTLVPLCPFVAAYIKRHPEYTELVMR